MSNLPINHLQILLPALLTVLSVSLVWPVVEYVSHRLPWIVWKQVVTIEMHVTVRAPWRDR
jgi:hypothetical protein